MPSALRWFSFISILYYKAKIIFNFSFKVSSKSLPFSIEREIFQYVMIYYWSWLIISFSTSSIIQITYSDISCIFFPSLQSLFNVSKKKSALSSNYHLQFLFMYYHKAKKAFTLGFSIFNDFLFSQTIILLFSFHLHFFFIHKKSYAHIDEQSSLRI